MTDQQYPQAFLEYVRSITNKRARTVIEHILKHGFITTEELKEQYGYDHPPRAARDVREQGVPLETFRVRRADGRTIGAYRFGDTSQIAAGRIGGRQGFPKRFKAQLVEVYGSRCGICSGKFEPRYLQIDHRVPYEVVGDADAGDRQAADYMLLCGSCNRAKSWSCEHCANWLRVKSPDICQDCYWAHPEAYRHAAMRPVRRLDITWTDDEVAEYDRLAQSADEAGEPMPEYVKRVLRTTFDALE